MQPKSTPSPSDDTLYLELNRILGKIFNKEDKNGATTT